MPKPKTSNYCAFLNISCALAEQLWARSIKYCAELDIIEIHTLSKKKRRYRIVHVNVFFQKTIKIRKLETELIENVIFAIFSNTLLIICGLNQ